MVLEKERVRRGGVIHRGALGDFITTVPIYIGLKGLFPSLRIHFHTKPAHAALLRDTSFFGGTTSADSADLSLFHHSRDWETAPLPSWLQQIDVLFFFGKKSSREVVDRLRRRLNVPVHWLESFPDPSIGVPVGRFLVEQVRAYGYPIPYRIPRLQACPDERRSVRKWLARHHLEATRKVVIHPGSGGRSKLWPLNRWLELVKHLEARNDVKILICLGPAEEPLDRFACMLESRGHPIVRWWPLPRLAALLATAQLYLGNDSGVTHLAAALGVPTIAVFGPASHTVWHPQGEQVKVVDDRWDPSEALVLQSENPRSVPPEVMRGIDCILS